TCGRKDRSRRSRGGRSRAVSAPCCRTDSSYRVPALERQSRRLRTAGRTQHRATAAPWDCGLATFRRSALFRRLSLPLLRTDRCRARSLGRRGGRNEQECHPSRVPGQRDETKTSGGFGSRLKRRRIGDAPYGLSESQYPKSIAPCRSTVTRTAGKTAAVL